MNIKDLCIKLSQCDTEQGVIDTLKKSGLWDDPKAWRHYGDNENNFSAIGNQQSKPEAALVEKLINSVDALIIAESRKRGISPDSKSAPQSIQEALIEFFNIPAGKLSNLNATERSRLAENICLVSSGAKSNPCYTIIDKGEGQTPNKMPETLLSLGKSNKLRIPSVQGKFNMGGTGVLQFCGKHNIQLIISKRHPEITKYENDATKNMWGITVVRREDPSGTMRSSVYKYLAPGGQVLSCQSEGLPLLPGEYPKANAEKMKWGTYIKLFEYQMTGLKTNILFDLYNRLSLLMPTVALPVRFYERRKGYTGHSMESTLSGLSVRLDEDKRDKIETGFPTSSSLAIGGQKLKASFYAFKRGKSDKYIKDEGIIFTVNGQTHASLSKSFFTRKAVGMGNLTGSVIAVVDCTNVIGRIREDLFMNSRDRLRSGDLRSSIEKVLEELIRNHQGLKELREKRRREDVENKLKDEKPLEDIIKTMLKKSPTLSKLFIEGIRLPNPFKTNKHVDTDSYKGKKFPSFFTLIKHYDLESPKPCPINSKFRIQYKTDAVNDYFERDNEPGTFSLFVNGLEIDDYSMNPWNGVGTLNVSLPAGVKVGDTLHFQSYVTDISRVDPITDEFYIHVTDPTKKQIGSKGTRKPPAGKKQGNDIDDLSYLAIPNVMEVRRDEWDKYAFDKESALKVDNVGEDGYDFYINMDNVHLLTEQKANFKIDVKLLEARYKYGMVLIGIALLKDHESNNGNNSDEEKEDIFTRIRNVTTIISPILLPMISSLGDLEVEETAAEYAEVV